MNQASETGTTVSFVAAGDLLLPAPLDGGIPRDFARALAPVGEVLAGCDIVLGNLECTLPGDGTTVCSEPRVISTPQAVRAIRSAGFNVVSLANNHAFDCLEGGFRNLHRLLDEIGVAYFGAGDDLEKASAPAIFNVLGLRVAFLGAADVQSGPFQQATADRAGVAPLDISAMTGRIHELAGQVDHVVVSLHWGRERLAIPSPRQVEQARTLIDAGASIVVGHHPHVAQGMELYRGRPIAYSLGNFVACEVPFADGDRVTWNQRERTGCLLLVDLPPGRVENIRQLATYDDGIQVRPDNGPYAQRIMGTANRAVARGVTLGRFRRQVLWVETIKPALDHLRWSKLKTLRLGKLKKAFVSAGKVRDSR